MLIYVLNRRAIRHISYNATPHVDSKPMRVIFIVHAPGAKVNVYIKIK
jgi:hypothetical protein